MSPDDTHMAFVTATPVTQYDNAGHLEMYTYEPSTRKIVCVSCNPSGAPATSDVGASQDGLFMTDDGRTFFSTADALVPGDTNSCQDVYEYVDGRPQLITPGTGDTAPAVSPRRLPGLIGVSADGTDVYFSTFDTLVPQDHNGLFLKFYDARVRRRLLRSPSPPSCEAADECHGPGSAPPGYLDGTGRAPHSAPAATSRLRHSARHAQEAHQQTHRTSAVTLRAARAQQRGVRGD